MLASARSEVGHLVRAARRAQALTGTLDWAPEEGYAVGYPGLEDEVFIGGVYVRLYLKDPQYPLRCVRRWVGGAAEVDVQCVKGVHRPECRATSARPAREVQSRGHPSSNRSLPVDARRVCLTVGPSWRPACNIPWLIRPSMPLATHTEDSFVLHSPSQPL